MSATSIRAPHLGGGRGNGVAFAKTPAAADCIVSCFSSTRVNFTVIIVSGLASILVKVLLENAYCPLIQ